MKNLCRDWMDNRERQLTLKDTNRKALTFEWGL